MTRAKFFSWSREDPLEGTVSRSPAAAPSTLDGDARTLVETFDGSSIVSV